MSEQTGPLRGIRVVEITKYVQGPVAGMIGAAHIGGLQVGQTYTISVDSRALAFTPLTVSVTGPVVGVDMIAQQ